jgi:hypothetical protein
VSPSIVVVLLLSKMQRSGDVERVALRARLAAWEVFRVELFVSSHCVSGSRGTNFGRLIVSASARRPLKSGAQSATSRLARARRGERGTSP